MCDCCRRLKAALWTARAQSETTTGLRNWFGTLTLSPAAQHQIVSRCRRRLSRGGTDFDALSGSEQFAERMIEIGREITLYIKRVRKESGAHLRYLLVAEAHRSGDPHLHMLIHEAEDSSPVRYRTLSTQWKLGFTKFNLVEGAKAARYICKYISKSAQARVRASLHYGNALRESDETERKESPQKESGKMFSVREIANARLLSQLSSSSLTDHSGGQENGIIDGGPWKQGPTSHAPVYGGEVRHTRPVGTDAPATEGLLGATDQPEQQGRARCIEPPF